MSEVIYADKLGKKELLKYLEDAFKASGYRYFDIDTTEGVLTIIPQYIRDEDGVYSRLTGMPFCGNPVFKEAECYVVDGPVDWLGSSDVVALLDDIQNISEIVHSSDRSKESLDDFFAKHISKFSKEEYELASGFYDKMYDSWMLNYFDAYKSFKDYFDAKRDSFASLFDINKDKLSKYVQLMLDVNYYKDWYASEYDEEVDILSKFSFENERSVEDKSVYYDDVIYRYVLDSYPGSDFVKIDVEVYNEDLDSFEHRACVTMNPNECDRKPLEGCVFLSSYNMDDDTERLVTHDLIELVKDSVQVEYKYGTEVKLRKDFEEFVKESQEKAQYKVDCLKLNRFAKEKFVDYTEEDYELAAEIEGFPDESCKRFYQKDINKFVKLYDDVINYALEYESLYGKEPETIPFGGLVLDKKYCKLFYEQQGDGKTGVWYVSAVDDGDVINVRLNNDWVREDKITVRHVSIPGNVKELDVSFDNMKTWEKMDAAYFYEEVYLEGAEAIKEYDRKMEKVNEKESLENDAGLER